jgi:hypothetical protein
MKYAPVRATRPRPVPAIGRHTQKVDALTLQLLQWLAERARSYPETIETWKTSCPRLTVWEDAVADGLVRVERGTVVLTASGREYVFAGTKPAA